LHKLITNLKKPNHASNNKIKNVFEISSFSVRIVNIWNSLSASVISTNYANTSESRLYRFWANQKLIFDYESTLTGTDNRGFVDNIDYSIF